MSLSPEEFERLTNLLQARKDKGLETQQPSQTASPEQPGILNRIGTDLQQRGATVNKAFNSDQSFGSKALQLVGQGAGFAGDILTEGIKSASNESGLTDNVFKPAIQAAKPHAVDFLNTEFGQKGLEAVRGGADIYASFKQAHPEAAGNLEAVINVASILPPAKAAQIVGGAVKSGVNTVKSLTNTTKLVENASSLVKRVNNTDKDIAGAIGEVLQGKTKDIAKGLNAFKAIDTSGVKTYTDLSKQVDKSISNLSKVVDDELARDTTTTVLSELSTKLKTKSGNIVSTNYVDTALNHLKELYTKTGDVQGAGNIDELLSHATTQGLTKQEINDIARVYNSEFGSKAFSKVGDPLTSVNAQLYETVRKGVKGKAREGIGGSTAKEADQTVSALYNTKKLVQNNVDAVNKLQQKISERGAFEKAGYLLSKYADIATGGTIRGIVGGILPRGAGYKTMNALDLEKRLENNLKIIDRASKAKTDAEMTKILSELDK
jgi:hypothetical protein